MKISEILLPTDFSAAAEAAALVATAMARETGARLHVVHVVPPATDPSLGSEQLTRLGRQLGKGLAVELALLSGRAAREITAYARDKGIDLIVMSTHGRTGVSRTLLGSVAEAVVRLSPCLVLTVPMALPTAGTPRGIDGARGRAPRAPSLHRLRGPDRRPRLRNVPRAHPGRGARAQDRDRAGRPPRVLDLRQAVPDARPGGGAP